MRIALLTETWQPSVDGIVIRLQHTVSALTRAGHQVLVIAPTAGPPSPGVVQHQTRSLTFPFIDPHRRWGVPDPGIARVLAEFQPTIVHVVNPVLMGAVALRAAVRRYPVVASFHTDIEAYLERYRLGLARRPLHAIMRATYRRADVRLATSPTGQRRLAALGLTDVALWPPGVDRTIFRPHIDGSRQRRLLNPEPHLPLALYVGRLAPEKGCELLRGPAAAPSQVHVTFVGDGPSRNRLERLFAGTHASFAGTLHGEDLAAAYSAADVLLFPSQTETVGLVLLEAMATELAIVAVDTPATRETLGPYPRAALVAVDASPHEWVEAVNVARATTRDVDNRTASAEPVPDLSWSRSTAELLDAYASALSPSARPLSGVITSR